jgi:nucleoside-diphosphate-sugar epimerase
VNILILGGLNSIVGHLVANNLAKFGFSVSVTGRRIGKFNLDPEIKIHVGELSDERFSETLLHGQDIIINSIAAYNTSLSVNEMKNSNYEIVRDLVEKVKNLKLFINLSTISVYGFDQKVTISRETKHNLSGPYGKYKGLLEKYLRQISKIPIIQLQLPAILSNPSNNHLINRIAEELKNDSIVRIYNPNSLFNNAISIDDLNDIILKLIQKNKISNDFFPIASSQPKEIYSLVNLMKKIIESQSEIEIIDIKVPSFSIDDRYARENYGYQSKTTQECIEEFTISKFRY